MKGLENQAYRIGYIVSNSVALLLFLSAWKWPRLARLLFFILFVWACCTNLATAKHAPQDYLGYASLTNSGIYQEFILGWFSRNIALTVGLIATCQGAIAIALLFRGWIFKLGLAGGITFLLAIAPLGVGAALPATIIMALGLVLLWKQDAFLFKSNPFTCKMAK